MWTRKELKDRAKSVLKLNYWRTVLVALIFTFVGGGASSGGGSIGGSSLSNSQNFEYADFTSAATEIAATEIAAIVAALAVIIIVVFAIALALSVFVFNPLIIGCQRFFIRCRQEQPGVGEVTYAFNHSYLNVVKITFLQGLYTFLWSLLFIVPGIIKAYEYKMIPFILAENPDMSSKEVFARTKTMMTGDKWNTFVLELSFLGWQILGALTCGILNLFYVNPYMYLTEAELYAVLKQKVDGSFDSSNLNGNIYTTTEDGSQNPYVQY